MLKLKRIKTLTVAALVVALFTSACGENPRSRERLEQSEVSQTGSAEAGGERARALTDRQRLGKQLGSKRLHELALAEIIDALINSDHPDDPELAEVLKAEADTCRRTEQRSFHVYHIAEEAERIVDDIEVALPRLCEITIPIRERALMPDSDTC